MNERDLRNLCARLGLDLKDMTKPDGWIDAPCPFAPWTHASGADHHPSFGVKVEDGGVSAFKCFTCHQYGAVAKLPEKLSFYRGKHASQRGEYYSDLSREASEKDTAGMDDLPDFESFRASRAKPGPQPLSEAVYAGVYPPVEEFPEALDYLSARGIGPDTARELGLRFDPEGGHAEVMEGQRHWFQRQRRVLFPVRDRSGMLYGFTGRTIDPQVQPKVRDYQFEKRHFVLGESRWEGQKPLILVEGLFAFAHLVEMGAEDFANVGALLGTEMTEEKAGRITSLCEPVYLLLDNDDAGTKAIFGDPDQSKRPGIADRLYMHVPTFVPAWPEGKADPDELSLREVQAMLNETDPYMG